jgi:hypothetical protein
MCGSCKNTSFLAATKTLITTITAIAAHSPLLEMATEPLVATKNF